MNRLLFTTFIFGFLFISNHAFGQAGTLKEYNFQHENINRIYFLYEPQNYDSAEEWPLILNFHGYTGDVPDHISRTQMHSLADSMGYIIAYPEGLTISREPDILPSFVPATGTGWSVPGFSTERNEIDFVDSLLSNITREYSIDKLRIHTTGLSLGGYMALYIATQMPDRIASFASVAGHMTEEVADLYSEKIKKSAMLVHGTNDPITNYSGSSSYIGVDVVAKSFATNNNCEIVGQTPVQLDDLDFSDNTTVNLLKFSGCDSGFAVEQYIINGGGHRWPGSGFTEPAVLGYNNKDISTSALIFEFFKQNPIKVEESFYQKKDQWKIIVDEYWGNDTPLSEKQEVFNKYADYADENFTLFSESDFDWDSLRSAYYDRITSDLSDGAFAGLIAKFSTEFQELHARFWDRLVQTTPAKHGIPIYYYNTLDVSHFGATLALQPDSTLLVVKTIEDHPLNLKPGDRIVGYEGIPWTQLTNELFEAELPGGGYLASAPESIQNFLMTNAGMNWHLFNTIDVIKYGETSIRNLSLEPMFETVPDDLIFTGEIWNNPQLSVAGIPFPNVNVFENSGAVTRGIIDFANLGYGLNSNKKIGYIYVTDHGYNEVETEFKEAVQFIMDSETDGLIVDLRWNGGGYINPRDGQSILFNEPANEPLNIMQSMVRCADGGLTDICNSRGDNLFVPFWFNWEVDPNTYYDKEIALLIGPETQSMGEYLAFQLASHPMTEVIGRPTNGGFSGNTESGVELGERWEANMPNFHIVSPSDPDVPFARSPLVPDLEVWLNPDDVANNVDTIVKTALEEFTVSNDAESTLSLKYVLNQNYPNPFNPNTNISFTLPTAGDVQLKVYNMIGQEVASLVNGRMNSGNHSVNFDAGRLSSGVYIYRLVAGNKSITKKMLLIK